MHDPMDELAFLDLVDLTHIRVVYMDCRYTLGSLCHGVEIVRSLSAASILHVHL